MEQSLLVESDLEELPGYPVRWSGPAHPLEHFEGTKYRYILWEIWDEPGRGKGLVNFCMLNPSTAEPSEPDPTVRRCINFAKDWGYDGICVTNLFAYRATSPENLKDVSEPVGPLNDQWIDKAAEVCDKVIAAWGNHGLYGGRSRDVISAPLAGQEVHHFGLTEKAEPKHPLYLPSDANVGVWLSV